MKMIGHTADLDDHRVFVDDDAVDIGEQLWKVFFADGDRGVFDMEDQMDIDLCE